jgi:hypothetical protein
MRRPSSTSRRRSLPELLTLATTGTVCIWPFRSSNVHETTPIPTNRRNRSAVSPVRDAVATSAPTASSRSIRGHRRTSHPQVRTPAIAGGTKTGPTIKLGKGITLRNCETVASADAGVDPYRRWCGRTARSTRKHSRRTHSRGLFVVARWSRLCCETAKARRANAPRIPFRRRSRVGNIDVRRARRVWRRFPGDGILSGRLSTYRLVHAVPTGDIAAAGFMVVPTFRWPHVTILMRSVDQATTLLDVLGPAQVNDRYAETKRRRRWTDDRHRHRR